MYNDLKEVVESIKRQTPQEVKISERTKKLIDTYRDHIFMTIVDDKVYVIKRGQLDIFNKDEVTIEYDSKGIKYLEPNMMHSRQHIGNPETVIDIMKNINMSRDDMYRYERYLFNHA